MTSNFRMLFSMVLVWSGLSPVLVRSESILPGASQGPRSGIVCATLTDFACEECVQNFCSQKFPWNDEYPELRPENPGAVRRCIETGLPFCQKRRALDAAVAAAAAAGTTLAYSPRILTAVGQGLRVLPAGAGFGLAGGLIGLPIFLGTGAAHAFEGYVNNYDTGINNGFSSDASNGNCPSGQRSVTYSYGSACVREDTPKYPACSELKSCGDVQTLKGGIILVNSDAESNQKMVCDSSEGGPYWTEIEIECLDGNVKKSQAACFELKCTQAPGLPPPPP